MWHELPVSILTWVFQTDLEKYLALMLLIDIGRRIFAKWSMDKQLRESTRAKYSMHHRN